MDVRISGCLQPMVYELHPSVKNISMEKDRSGRFRPGKGRPSNDARERQGMRADADRNDRDSKATEKNTRKEENPADAVPVRHPNRNANKERKQQEKKETPITRELSSNDLAPAEPQELPGILYRKLFEYLANYSSPICITIFQPTHQKGMEVNENNDAMLFRGMLTQVTKMLEEKQLSKSQIERILEPAFDFLRSDPFRSDTRAGLAVFMAEGVFHYIKLSIATPEEIHINSSFYVAPLVPAMTMPEHYFILAISKKLARFFRADAFGIEEIEIDELPRGEEDVVHFEEKDERSLFRTGGRGGTGVTNTHGIGTGKPDEKTNLALYLKEVDRTLWTSVLAREQSPLLLAGVEYEVAIYRQVSQYHFIAPEILTGNYENEPASLIFEKAKQKMAYYFDQRLQKALHGYLNNSANQLTSSIADDVIPASYYGQVNVLFAQKGAHIWGRFDEQKNELHIHDSKMEGDDCLLDKAIVKTIANGGEVHILEREKMPANSQLAALFRY